MDYQIFYESYKSKYVHKTEALFHALKDGIVSGRIASGSKLPSSRKLAESYGLSRGTVNVAYEMLHSQGYVRSETGSGTFVAYRDPAPNRPGSDADPAYEPSTPSAPALSGWGARIGGMPLLRANRDELGTSDPPAVDFSLGKVDVSHFPVKEWNRLMFEQVRLSYAAQLGDAFDSEGHAPLRESIARHLRRTRGLAARPDEVAIVNGSQHALTLLIQLLVDPGDTVITENPLYGGVRRAVAAAGGHIRAFPVDRDGIVFEPADESAKLLVVTPSRQFPTGAVLAMERRVQLLEWAERTGAYVIEDDYDSEFRHKGRPIEPLKALDRTGRVAYIGTFSRTMMQDIRLGYAVLPKALTVPFGKAKQLYETHPASIMEQRALAAFMSGGLYERHLRRMRRIYKRRNELLTAQLKDRLASLFAMHDSDAGLHVYAEWKRTTDELDLFSRHCERFGVRFADTRGAFIGSPVPSACFGFAHLDERQIAEGVERLAKAAALLQ